MNHLINIIPKNIHNNNGDLMQKKFILKIMASIFIIGIIISIFNIMIWFIDNKNTKRVTTLVNNAVKIKDKKEDVNEVTYELVNPPLDKNDPYYKYINEELLNINFDELKKINSDVVGYIEVPGTEVKYPVVKTSDNKYYLRHSFDKSYNKAGWIFMDYRNDAYDYQNNTIIYGHKRNDGSMFTSLKNVLTNDWLKNEENYIIKLANEKESTLWQIFSVYKIEQESYYITTKFKTEKLYKEFLEDMQKRSIFDFKTSVNTKDKILTLSTCYDYNGKRVVIHAKLIKRGH